MSSDKQRRLGRGLEALIAAREEPSAPESQRGALHPLPIAQIRPNPYQPRKDFRPEELAELEASLRASGLLQPITVRPSPSGQGYELIAGERRLRAATRLGWTEIPAVIKPIDDQTLLTLALVENLQRADLNSIEEAEGYQRLIAEFALTQQQVADLVGKDRSTVANLLRLLNLPVSVRHLVQDAQITLGHARALLALDDEHAIVTLAREIVAKGLTVRDVERRARETASAVPRARRAGRRPADQTSTEAKRIADELRSRLQTDVTVTAGSDGRGTIAITFYSADDLDRLLDVILGAARERL
jgi:ParB family chromosome partitioning protein